MRILRAMSVWQRLAQLDALNAMADAFTMADMRGRQPDATETQARQSMVR